MQGTSHTEVLVAQLLGVDDVSRNFSSVIQGFFTLFKVFTVKITAGISR